MKEILLFISALLCYVSTLAQSSSCSNVIKEDSVRFSKKSVFLNWAAKKKLYHLAMVLNRNPDCKIAVTGYGNSCLSCQQTSWDRVYSVIKYLRKGGVDSTRFIFSAAQDGENPLVVSVRNLQLGEDGPAMTAPPIPCYSYHRLTKKRCKGSF
jgi:hypothetical protein